MSDLPNILYEFGKSYLIETRAEIVKNTERNITESVLT